MTVIAVTIIALVKPHRCIADAYRAAAEAWAAGLPLFQPGLRGFLYPPTGALVYLPSAQMPEPLGSHLWRLSLAATAFTVRPLAGQIAPTATWTPGGGRRCLPLAGLCLALGAHLRGDWLYRPTGFWLKQTVTTIHLVQLFRMITLRRPLVLRVAG